MMLLISVDSDGLMAHASPKPEAFELGAVTRDQVLKALVDEGVVYGMDDQAVATIIAGIESGDRDLPPVEIARGKAPLAGEPPELKFFVKANMHVPKGALLVSMRGGKPPEAGRKVCGAELPAPRAPSDPIVAGDHIEFVEADRTFRAQAPGHVAIDGKRIGIDPSIRISDDGLSAVFEYRSTNEDIALTTPADFSAMLRDSGVVEGVDPQALNRVLNIKNTQRGNDEPVLVVVARGTEMQCGDDASIEFHEEGGRQTGELQPDGTMDYHWQLITSVVETGRLLAEKTPFTEGIPGRTVRGEEIPAEPGSDCDLQPGENIAVSSDGLQFSAKCNGVFVREGDSFRVVDLFVVQGDVNFTTGNLNFDRSGVYIQGSVRSTFSVQASGSVLVQESVEDAIVESGDNVDISKGILQRRLGSVRAVRRVTAAFAHDARIIAGDEIVIRESAFRSFLAARNRIVLVDGKGVLIGGHAVAGQSIEVRCAGSDAFARAVIQVGLDYQKMKDVEDRLGAVEAELARLAHALGKDLDQIARGRMAPPKDRRRRALVEQYIACEAKRETLCAERSRLLKDSRCNAHPNAWIIIRELAHPGVELIIADKTHKVATNTSGRFAIDRETDHIVQESI